MKKRFHIVLISSLFLNLLSFYIIFKSITINEIWNLNNKVLNPISSGIENISKYFKFESDKKLIEQNLEDLNINSENLSATHIVREDIFKGLEIDSNDIIFVGDSLTDLVELSELFKNNNVKNRGISGDNSYNIKRIISNIIEQKPRKIFLMFGINDLIQGVDENDVLNNYRNIISEITSQTEYTEVYIQSVLPINNDIFIAEFNNSDIENLNNKLMQLSNEFNVNYLDLYDSFIVNNKLNNQFTTDGVHLNYNGYIIWKNLLEKYIEG